MRIPYVEGEFTAMLPYFSKSPVWLKAGDPLEALRGRHVRVVLPSGGILHMILKLGVYESRDGECFASIIMADPTKDDTALVYLTTQSLGLIASATPPEPEWILDLRAKSPSNLNRYLPCLHTCP